MLTPTQVENLIRYLVNEIIKLIEDTDIKSDKNKQRLLLGIDELFNDLDIGLAEHIPKSLLKRYIEGIQQAESDLEGLGMSVGINADTDANKLVRAPLHKEAITNIVTDTMTDLAAATRTAKAYANKNVDKAINDVKTELANGMIAGSDTKTISKRVAQKFADQNMTAFVTVDGKHLPLDFYAKTVTRTKMRTAENHGTLNRYKDRKVKHVYVTGNIPTCAECARYRGIVFATERGDTFPYINLYTTFPLHPNCECNFRPWLMKFKSKQEIDQAKDKAKTFNPNVDPRTQKERDKYANEQKRRQAARRKQMAYNKMKAKLGKEGPKSYAEYTNAFNNDKSLYHTWVAKMKGIHSKPEDMSLNNDKEQVKAKEQVKEKEQIDTNDQVNAFDEQEAIYQMNERVAEIDEEVAEIMFDIFNSEEIEMLPQRDNFIRILNSVQEEIDFTDSVTKHGHASHYDPNRKRVYLKPQVMQGIKEGDYNHIPTFAHEFAHGIDNTLLQHIKKKKKKKNGIEFNKDADRLNHLFKGLDLREIVSQELKYNAFKDFIELKDFKHYQKNNFADFDADIDKAFSDKIEQTKKKKPSASDIKKVRRMNMAKRARTMIDENNRQIKGDIDNYKKYNAYSDMLSSLNVEAKSMLGHSRSYWGSGETTRRKRGSEIFAEISEIFANPESYKHIKEKLPNTLDAYLKIIQEASRYI